MEKKKCLNCKWFPECELIAGSKEASCGNWKPCTKESLNIEKKYKM